MIHVVVSVMAHHYGILAEIFRIQKCLGEGIKEGPAHVSGAAIAHSRVHCYQRADGLGKESHRNISHELVLKNVLHREEAYLTSLAGQLCHVDAKYP